MFATGRRCEPRDWIGRESGYADFADEGERHVTGPRGASLDYANDATVVAPTCCYLPLADAFLSPDRARVCCLPGAPCNTAVASSTCDVPFSTNGTSLSIDDLASSAHSVASSLDDGRSLQVSSCSAQVSSCSRVGPNGVARACAPGPVDVEDLALYFDGAAKPQLRDCRQSSARHDEACTAAGKQVVRQSAQCQGCTRSAGCEQWPGAAHRFTWTDPFDFCDEKRWLRCPASDRCPLYADPSPCAFPCPCACAYDATTLPPCLYENLQTGRGAEWAPGYAEESQFLEDYLSNEKRKERSRDAARCRRSRETDIFSELAAALPVPPEQAAHLDKASVMRLAIAYLKARAVVDSMPGPLAKSESAEEMDELFPKALNGFMLVLSSDGNMVYLSENVSDYLGVSQMDMMGQSVYEYSHPCDHDELRECLTSKPAEKSDKYVCNFFLRLKCTLTSKGRKVNLKSASYKVIHCTGRLTCIRDSNSNCAKIDDEERSSDVELDAEHEPDGCLVLVGCPIPHPSNIEVPLGRDTFLSKHSLNMKFTYADEKLAEYLGWNSEELVGQSVFEFYHALDNVALDKSFKSLFSKGQCETVAYRFLSKKGGYAWVITQATLIHCSKQHKPLSVVCVNYILSGVEREDEVYSVRQLAARDSASVVKAEKLAPDKQPQQPPPPVIAIGAEGPKIRLAVRITGSSELEEAPFAGETREEPAATPPTREEPASRPLTVTATIFRSAATASKGKRADKDGSRKDNAFPRPVPVAEDSFADVEALKESLDDSLRDSLKDSLKENDQPPDKAPRRKPRPEFVFQGKPAVDYEPEVARRDRPQTVTRNLFAPLTVSTGQQQQQESSSCRPAPQTATASIFAPRTEDMNKGFLTFSEDQPGLTMLKDEPEDLTHLAPTPGDVCVPLEDTPFLSDMLDEFILGNDNYCPLLSPGGALAPEFGAGDLGEPLKPGDLVDPVRNKSLVDPLVDPLADSDPFMYGDSPGSPCSIDPNSVSPPLGKYRQMSLVDPRSPERSIDSLGSPTGGSGGEGLSEDEMLMLGISDTVADDELALRAPYIPMSDQDEALELLISDDMVMWGPNDKTSSKWLVDEREERTADSSLAQLLRTDQVVSRRYNDHGGGLVNPAQVLGQMPRKNATLESSRWSAKASRGERPSKRVHGTSMSARTENKRIKCEEPRSAGVNDLSHLEAHLLSKQASRGATAAATATGNVSGSQLLRRLVSQQSVPGSGCPGELQTGAGGLVRRDEHQPRGASKGAGAKELMVADDGGGDDRRRRGNPGAANGPRLNASSNSVLMNLLVSGCDDATMDSRNVPILLQKDLTSPLSVDLDNQTVPQLSNGASPSVSLDHLSPDIRKQLIGSFASGPVPMSSPTTNISFDCLDYDVGTGSGTSTCAGGGLLQVGSDLFGSLLDRTLV